MKNLGTLFSRSTVILLSLCSLLCGCTGFKATTGGGSSGSKNHDGNSSGGGGFGDQNSMLLLDRSKQLTADGLLHSNPQIFKELPKGWTPERLAKLIQNIHAEPNLVVYRYNRELMFDYKIPKKGEPYLIATALFFRANSAVPINGLWDGQLEPYFREIRLKLLHEAAHVLGIGTSEKTDYKAGVFARYLSSVLNNNNFICSATDMPENYFGVPQDYTLEQRVKFRAKRDGINLGETWGDEDADEDAEANEEDTRTNEEKAIDAQVESDKKLPYYWIFNRANGFGIQATKSYELKQDQDPKYKSAWLDDLLEGKPISYNLFARSRLVKQDRQSELERWYVPTSWVDAFTENGLTSQYLGKWTQDGDGFASMSDEENFTSNGSTTNDNGDPCKTMESFKIPFKSAGKFEAKYDYMNTCDSHTIYDENGELISQTSLPSGGSVQLKCMESFETLTLMSQFYGDQEFTDPDLLEIVRYSTSLE